MTKTDPDANPSDPGSPEPPSAEEDHERVLRFWFGELDADGLADAAHVARWWKKDPSFDEELRGSFLDEHQQITAGRRASWLATPRGRLAYVIVLDQLSRNMFRDTPDMFEQDYLALQAALEGIGAGWDRALRTDERVFLYMPLMHSEELTVQERCVELFEAYRDELEGPARERVARNLEFARRHRDIVARFGRFPHRNSILGRDSSEEETEFLKQPGSSF